MKVFITGANGLIGSAVVKAVVQSGHEVLGLVRSPVAATAVKRLGGRPITGDLADSATYRHHVAESDAVVHTAVGHQGRVTDADHAVVASMLEALAGRAATFVLTSGLGVYACTTADLIDEETPLDSVIPAQQPRAALEQVVLGARGDLRTVVVRPAHVFGHGRTGLFTRVLLDASRSLGAGVYIGDGAGWYGAVHADDLAAGYAAILDTPRAGGAYNVVSQHITMRELAKAMGHSVSDGSTLAVSPTDAATRFGPLAPALLGAPPVSVVAITAAVGWTPKSPTLVFELVRGSLCEVGYAGRMPGLS